ncbi:DUF3781 domain-containing protein [Polaribacter undariae]|uniref:DUF3781 domain-containing protein n=1 Tax=Polaribacter sejongensis TaxID=985043 RepID=A0AAJ1QV11_9FLAO|nr:DUF3781 domain-containing protein [Polaribacter undariae]MDN3618595.1 DUF3781 domain-containing protein [Polaribacter undariae]UWD30424.1 DUF3781 domain-containing protein [Polaribacter undariae]
MIKINKAEILEKHCYTELVYLRINKKLKTAFSKDEIEKFIRKVLEETTIENYLKKGKNFYISNFENNIRITVNSNTFRIITVDRI